MRVVDLRCEHMVEPLCVASEKPRLSFRIESERPGVMQSAYRIQAASSTQWLSEGKYDLWDSGKVASARQSALSYCGALPEAGQTIFWRVTAWDLDGREAVSDPSYFEMGWPDRAGAKWIGRAMVAPANAGQCDYLRREFTLDRAPARARLYITALGLYEAYVNGMRVGSDVLTPGCTDYHKRVPYQAYDVTALLKKGKNALGALLSAGWYSGRIAWQDRNVYGPQPALKAQLWVWDARGNARVLATDGRFKASGGALVEADLLDGEFFDATAEQPGWNLPGFSDGAWEQAVTVRPGANGPIEAQRCIGVREIDRLPAKSVNQLADDRFLVDFGQNIVGVVCLRVHAPAGREIVLRHGEMLEDGELYTANLRSAKCVDRYIASGMEGETYEPRFTFHGFRYAQISGVDSLEPADVQGVVWSQALDQRGDYECENALVNQLVRNTRWGMLGNFVSIPTDCPQRDERLGWTGDGQVFLETGLSLARSEGFYEKWLRDVLDAQREDGAFTDVAPSPMSKDGPLVGAGVPAWGDAGVIVPWTLYKKTGDARVLEQSFDAALSWIGFQRKLRDERGVGLGRGYGDWLSIGEDAPKDVIATAFLVYSADIAANMARVLGRAEIDWLLACRDAAKAAFIEHLIDADGRISGDTQTGYLLALKMDIVDGELKAKAIDHLIAALERNGWCLATGFVGVSYLLSELSRAGRDDIAYRLLHNTEYPSWLFPIVNGATTIWERWDSWTPEGGFQTTQMNSFNHYAYGSVVQWLFEYSAGISAAAGNGGAYDISIHPRVRREKDAFARAHTECLAGRIAVHWYWRGDTLACDVLIPCNARAHFIAPIEGAVSIDGAPAQADESGRYALAPGRHAIQIG